MVGDSIYSTILQNRMDSSKDWWENGEKPRIMIRERGRERALGSLGWISGKDIQITTCSWATRTALRLVWRFEGSPLFELRPTGSLRTRIAIVSKSSRNFIKILLTKRYGNYRCLGFLSMEARMVMYDEDYRWVGSGCWLSLVAATLVFMWYNLDRGAP